MKFIRGALIPENIEKVTGVLNEKQRPTTMAILPDLAWPIASSPEMSGSSSRCT
jgi:hypothetical protein